MKRSSARTVLLAAIVLLGVLLTVLLPLTFPPGGGPTGFDRAVAGKIHSALDAHTTVLRGLVTPSDSPLIVPIMLVGVLWYAWRRDWWRAGFLFLAPELVVAINTFALKYVWHRQLHHYLAYPSGHTVQFMAIAVGFVLVATSTRIRTVEIVITAVLLVAIAIGMVGLGYHYPTDILGGTATAIAMMTAIYGVLVAARSRQARRRQRSVTTQGPRPGPIDTARPDVFSPGRTAGSPRSRTTPATPPR